MRFFYNTMQLAFIYMVSVIGAGFVSGQEIVQFFTQYGQKSFWGVFVAGLLFSIVGALILEKIKRLKLTTFEEYLKTFMPDFLVKVLDFIVTIFLFITFCVMIAGMTHEFKKIIEFDPRHLALLITIICLLSAVAGIKTIIKLSLYFTPILIIGLFYVGSWLIYAKISPIDSGNISNVAFSNITSHSHFWGITHNWLASGLIYVSYNILLSAVLLCSLLPVLKRRKQAVLGGMIGGVLLMLTAGIVNLALFMSYAEIAGVEFPIKEIIRSQGNDFIYVMYTGIVLCALYISSVTNAFCFLERIKGMIGKSGLVIALPIICVLSVYAAQRGFAGLISTFYPLFGVAGIVLLVWILWNGVRDMIKRKIR